MANPIAHYMARRATNPVTFPAPVLILIEHAITDTWLLRVEDSKSVAESTLTYIDGTHAMYQFSDAFKSKYRLVHSRWGLEEESDNTGNLPGIQLTDPQWKTPPLPATEKKRASQQVRTHEPPPVKDSLLKQDTTDILTLYVEEPKLGGE